MRLYAEPALYESARIIDYDCIPMTEFWKKVKKLDLPQHDVLMAVYDLTRAARRAEEPARYELNGAVRGGSASACLGRRRSTRCAT